MDVLQDKDFQQDMMKFATMLSFSKSFASPDREWQMASIYTLIGFGAYHAVTKKLYKNEFDGPTKAVLNTWLKVGTMLAVSRALSGKPFDKEYLMDSLFTLAGFNAFDVFTNKFVPQLEDKVLSNIAKDAIVVGTMSTVKQVLSGKPINNAFVVSSLQTLGGFVIYDIISGMQ